MTRLTRDERIALVYNCMTATSVTVVDIDKRRVLNEVLVPGCSCGSG